MPWSLVHDGVVRDISFRNKQQLEGLATYRVYVGEEEWGQVSWYSNRVGWIASSFNYPEGFEKRTIQQMVADENDRSPRPDLSLRSVAGFKSRRAAATYIIKHHGYWKNS